MSQRYDVKDTTTCGRCGTDVPPDGEEEYRHRIVMEDLAEPGGMTEGTKLCNDCWHDFYGQLTE